MSFITHLLSELVATRSILGLLTATLAFVAMLAYLRAEGMPLTLGYLAVSGGIGTVAGLVAAGIVSFVSARNRP